MTRGPSHGRLDRAEPLANPARRVEGDLMRTFLRLHLVGATILAMLAGSGSAVLAQQAETPEVTSELLFELAIPRSALPDDFTALEGGTWTLEAGTDVTGEPQASQANESMRNRAFLVTSGSLLIEPTTEALLWRTPDTTPVVTPANVDVTLGPGEAIYLPAVSANEIDPLRYLRVANPGTEDATGFTFHAHEGSMGDSFGGFPTGLRWGTWTGRLTAVLNDSDWTSADEAVFRLTRHDSDPGGVIESPAASATRAYFVESGTVQQVRSRPDGESTALWGAGANGKLMSGEDIEQTLTAVGDEAALFLELAAIPRSTTSE